MTRVGVARAEKVLAGEHQACIGEGASGRPINEHLRRFVGVDTGKLVATGGCKHKFVQQLRLLLDLSRAGDYIGCVVVRDTIVSDREDIELHTLALRLDDFPALKDPHEIDPVGLQRLHGINAQRHILKLAFTAILLDDFTHDRRFVGGAKAAIDLAIQVTRARQSRTGKRDQRRGIVLDDGGKRNYGLTRGGI